MECDRNAQPLEKPSEADLTPCLLNCIHLLRPPFSPSIASTQFLDDWTSVDYHNEILQRASKRESVMDDEKLNSARKRLQENYQEANNAKKQRTIQVMDIHDIPKPKNAFFAKNKGNFQGRHHR